MGSKPPILPGNHHLVVYLPTEDDREVTELQSSGSMCWLVKSYEEAIRTVQDFIMGDEFISDLECRFEIFDEFLEAVGDQKLFESLVIERLELETSNEEVIITPPTSDVPTDDLSIDVEEVETLFGDRDIHVPYRNVALPETKPAPKPAPKEVKFDEIKVEDNRT